MWRTLLTRRAGARGTKRLAAKYGERLVCVRTRYDPDTGDRYKTVELTIERLPARERARPEPNGMVYVRVNENESLLRRAVLQSGGRWDELTGLWRVMRERAESLGIQARIVRRRGTIGGANGKRQR